VRELKLIVRSLGRTPGFTAATIATLALGLGTVTALFSVVDQVVRRPLPYSDPDRILRAWTRTHDGDVEDFSFRVVEYQELAGRTDRFDAVAGEFPIDLPVNLPGQHPFQTQGRMVTPDFFEVFGTRPARGRMFRAEEIAGGSALVTVVTHRFWIRHLGASPDAVGRAIDLGDRPYTVIGVLPAAYWHVSGSDVDVFVPYTIGTSGWIGRWLDLYFRIPVTASPAEVEAEVSAVVAGIGRTDARSEGWHATVATVQEMVVGDVRLTAWTTFAASGLLLAIACANVVNLMLARGTMRTRELALRVALGADRARLIRHVLAESTILAAGGGVVGFFGAWLGIRVLIALAPDVPRISSLSLDPIAGLFGAGLVGLTAIVCGLAPAVRQTRTALTATGHASTRSQTGRFGGLLSGLVIAELALATGLVVAAGLVMRTFHALSEEDYGFRAGRALTFRVSPPSSRWAGRDARLLSRAANGSADASGRHGGRRRFGSAAWRARGGGHRHLGPPGRGRPSPRCHRPAAASGSWLFRRARHTAAGRPRIRRTRRARITIGGGRQRIAGPPALPGRRRRRATDRVRLPAR
jgi:putative ABC transport system permease protein